MFSLSSKKEFKMLSVIHDVSRTVFAKDWVPTYYVCGIRHWKSPTAHGANILSGLH